MQSRVHEALAAENTAKVAFLDPTDSLSGIPAAPNILLCILPFVAVLYAFSLQKCCCMIGDDFFV